MMLTRRYFFGASMGAMVTQAATESAAHDTGAGPGATLPPGAENLALRFADRAAAAGGDIGSARLLAIGPRLYAADPGGTALTTKDGQRWRPVPPVFIDHWDLHADGDGDDTDAIQAAVDHCLAAGLGELHVPDGTYAVRNVVVGGDLYLHGGAEGAVFRVVATEGAGFTFEGRYSGFVGCRLKGEGQAETGVAWAVLDGSHGRGLLYATRIEEFRTGILNHGRGGLIFDQIEVLGCTGTGFRSAGNFMESKLLNSRVWSFSDGGNAVEIDREHSDLVNPEGWVIDNCTLLAAGGSPFICRAGLAGRVVASTLSEAARPILIDASVNGITGVQFVGCYFQVENAGPRATLHLRGGALSHVKLIGGEIVHENGATGLWIEGEGPQSLRVIGVDFRVADGGGDAPGTVGIANEAGKAVFVSGCTFNRYSGAARNVLEGKAAVARYDGNRFDVPPYGELSANSSLGVNYGAGSSAATGGFTDLIQDGTRDDPALAFQSRPTTGLRKFGDGIAFVHDGQDRAALDGAGLFVPRTRALRGEAERVPRNGAIAFVPQNPVGLLLVTTEESVCEFRFAAAARRTECVMLTPDPAPLFAAASGPLGGTDGAADRVTVSTHSDGRIYIENRRETQSIRVSVRF